MNNNESNLFHIQAICERLPFTRPESIDDENYTESLTGDWNDVPAWAIRRINFHVICRRFDERSRCPRGKLPCTMDRHSDLSCSTIKHCYPYLCDGSCGHNEIWVNSEEKALIMKYRKEKYG